MQRILRFGALLPIYLLTPACGDDTTGSGPADGSGGGSSSAGGTAAATTSSTSGAGTTTASASTSQAGGTTGGGEGGDTGEGGDGGSAPVVCTQAREDALGAIEAVSEGDVLVLEEDDGDARIWVDASAGGLTEQASNPWIYVDLTTLSRVDVDDVQADSDTAWDLALKRPILRANNHDGGTAGAGESAFLAADFDDVTADEVAGADFGEEHWFDQECNLITDPTGAIATSFDGWYLYEDMVVSPASGTWLVRGGTGDEVFKLAILDYYANDDGTSGQAGGRYLLRVAPLSP